MLGMGFTGSAPAEHGSALPSAWLLWGGVSREADDLSDASQVVPLPSMARHYSRLGFCGSGVSRETDDLSDATPTRSLPSMARHYRGSANDCTNSPVFGMLSP